MGKIESLLLYCLKVSYLLVSALFSTNCMNGSAAVIFVSLFYPQGIHLPSKNRIDPFLNSRQYSITPQHCLYGVMLLQPLL